MALVAMTEKILKIEDLAFDTHLPIQNRPIYNPSIVWIYLTGARKEAKFLRDILTEIEPNNNNNLNSPNKRQELEKEEIKNGTLKYLIPKENSPYSREFLVGIDSIKVHVCSEGNNLLTHSKGMLVTHVYSALPHLLANALVHG